MVGTSTVVDPITDRNTDCVSRSLRWGEHPARSTFVQFSLCSAYGACKFQRGKAVFHNTVANLRTEMQLFSWYLLRDCEISGVKEW